MSDNGIPSSLSSLAVAVDSLRPYGRNPRRGDLGTIKESLAAHGQYRPIVVNERTREVLAGNHTLAAAVELGWTEIAATFVDVDDEHAARIVLVDNRANDQAGYDEHELVELLQSLPDLAGTGFVENDLDQLLAELDARAPGEGGDTDPGAVPEQPRTRPGELIVLGEHRLLCGDATSEEDLRRLADGERAACMWTDPPYGVDYEGKTKSALRLRNDSQAGLAGLLEAAFAQASAMLAAGAAIYVAHPAGPLSLVFGERFVAAGWQLRQTLVWVKDSMVLGHTDYHYRHEPLLYGFAAGAKGRRGRGGAGWLGDHTQTTVFEVPRPKASREHPTMKPVELIEQHLVNSSAPGHLVLDPFAGSGSTLIACENLGRRCLALELDPGYCDVIADRWERHTGQTAQREEAGSAAAAV